MLHLHTVVKQECIWIGSVLRNYRVLQQASQFYKVNKGAWEQTQLNFKKAETKDSTLQGVSSSRFCAPLKLGNVQRAAYVELDTPGSSS